MSDFDFEDSSRRPRRRGASHSGSAFGTMFGGALGCFSAWLLVFVVVPLLTIAIGVGIWIGVREANKEPEPPPAKRR